MSYAESPADYERHFEEQDRDRTNGKPEAFKFGTWYPIETRESNSTDKGDLIWIEAPMALPPRAPRSAGWVNEHQGWHRATHWMPRPPSPEEMAAKPSLETVVRSWLDVAEMKRQAEDGNPPEMQRGWSLVAEAIEDMLAEAGLE